MKKYSSYPFYNSIRFRLGLLFNSLLLLFLSAIIFLMYAKVKREFENNFTLRLSAGATSLLQKTTVNPIVVALPQVDEMFLLTYNNTIRTDTLFSNLSAGPDFIRDSIQKNTSDWRIRKSKKMDTGGTLTIVYALPAGSYYRSIQQLQSLLVVYIPAAIFISILAGYFLSGIFLLPLTKIVKKANHTDLTAKVILLDEPVFRDELHELTVAFNRMLQRIDNQYKMQNAFFAAASHELRTPLSNMLTELQTTDVGDSSTHLQQLLQHQVGEVQRLKRLVDNFLLMSRLKANSVTVNKSRVAVVELCMDIIKRLEPQANENRLRFMLNLSPADEEMLVFADKDHLSIILGNLLSNCVKYSAMSSVVRVDILKKECLELTIQNETELVIDDVSLLQEQFTRVDNYKEGCGLGLWIATHLSSINDAVLSVSYSNKVFKAVLRICG